jgi:hypothetical protein
MITVEGRTTKAIGWAPRRLGEITTKNKTLPMPGELRKGRP